MSISRRKRAHGAKPRDYTRGEHAVNDGPAAMAGARWRCYVARVQRLHVFALASVLVLPSAARAYEDQVVLELGVGYVGTFGDEAIPAGVRGDLGVLIGLSPTLSIGTRLEGGHLRDGDANVSYGAALVELVYAIDIVTAVPRFSFGARGMVGSGSLEGVGGDLGFDLGIGVDFLPRSGPNYGIEFRATLLLLDGLVELGPVLLGLTFRVGFPFDR